ncbi:MAG: hypothetical protein GF418_01220 [Chitinivibrionales bacterium]|nr:hypothetical protein [Chitinivibrionales bacterium]MBD3394222.1 hypothetical protein [Chitinivibrionales bacterium]
MMHPCGPQYRYRPMIALLLCACAGVPHAKTIIVSRSESLGKRSVATGGAAVCKTLQSAVDMAHSGDSILVEPGTYSGWTTVRDGTPEDPIVIMSAKRWGASIQDAPHLLPKARRGTRTKTATIVLGKHQVVKGMVFENMGTVNPPPNDEFYGKAVLSISKGDRVEDCRFTNCVMGIAMDQQWNSYDSTQIIRCVFENMKWGGVWSFGTYEKRMRDHLLKDCIFRRCNTNNWDHWNAGCMKYLFTRDVVIDGVINYDNNGNGVWLDWAHDNFTIKNCTAFGNHTGESISQYDNYGETVVRSHAGKGIYIEGDEGGLVENCTFYSNYWAGLGISESGFDGGVTIRNCRFVEERNGICFRSRLRDEEFTLGYCDIQHNLFKDWSEFAWRTHDSVQTITEATPIERGFTFDNNTYDCDGCAEFARWQVHGEPPVHATTLAEVRDLFDCDHNGTMGSYEFDGPFHEVHLTTLDDVGTDAMWQIPSQDAEANHIDNALQDKSVGQTVSIPVTGRKAIEQSGSNWVTELYDLQCRHVKLTMNEGAKQWVQTNVRDYASTAQTDVEVVLTRKEEYVVEASMEREVVQSVSPAAMRSFGVRIMRLGNHEVLITGLGKAARVWILDARGNIVAGPFRPGTRGTVRIHGMSLAAGLYLADIRDGGHKQVLALALP